MTGSPRQSARGIEGVTHEPRPVSQSTAPSSRRGTAGGLGMLKYFVCIVPVSFGNLSEIHFSEGNYREMVITRSRKMR